MDRQFMRFLVDLGLGNVWAGSLVHLVKIVVILLAAVVGGRMVTRAARRSVEALTRRSPLAEATRAGQRAKTLGGVVASAIRVAVLTVALLMVIDELGVNVGPLLAGAGIVGVAIAFGAQSLVKDIVTGFFILAEDQYGVGDVVQIEGVSGTVEEVNLRLTRVRATDGTVWFVPNGEIRKVGNACKGWARAVVDLTVPAKDDLDEAMTLIGEEAAKLTDDPTWGSFVLEAPKVAGIESVSVDAVVVRVTVKTAPQQQDAVARELRGRLIARLRAARLGAAVSSPGPAELPDPPA